MINLKDGLRRHLTLAAYGALCGLIFWLLVRDGEVVGDAQTAAATAVAIAGVILAFTLSGVRSRWSALFAVMCGTIAGGVVWWNLRAGPQADSSAYGTGFVWQYLCLFAALAIALPAYQTVRDEDRRRLPYETLHQHSWGNIVIAMGAGGFVLAVSLLFALWASLFNLIGVKIFGELFAKPVFSAVIGGATVSLGISLAREWSAVMNAMQRALVSVLSVLTPFLAFVLLLFLCFLPVTGLSVLWDTTRHATPLMLGAVLFALLLANAVVRETNGQAPSFRILRSGAAALGFVMLPLAVIAAVSTGRRIDAYGLMPDRMWAMIFTGFAIAYGLCYLWPLIRGFNGWADAVRTANVRLGLALGAVFLLLATPVIDFREISARNQTARLMSGKAPVETFDFAALKFDLGAPGRDALSDLRGIGDHPQAKRIRQEVARIDKTPSPWEAHASREAADAATQTRAALKRMSVYGGKRAIPTTLIDYLSNPDIDFDHQLKACGGTRSRCMAVIADLNEDGREDAVFFRERCTQAEEKPTCWSTTYAYSQTADGWREGLGREGTYFSDSDGSIIKALEAGKLDIVPRDGVELRVNGKRVAGID